MKMLIISIAMVISLCTAGFAQSPQKLQSGDSIRVEVERTILSGELTQLRDSITQSLKVIDSRLKKAPESKKQKLEASRKDLSEYLNLVKLDIKELSLTAKNGWTHEAVERIRANTEATRKEFKRIASSII